MGTNKSTSEKIAKLKDKQTTIRQEMIELQQQTTQIKRWREELEAELRRDEDRHMIVMLQYELNRK